MQYVTSRIAMPVLSGVEIVCFGGRAVSVGVDMIFAVAASNCNIGVGRIIVGVDSTTGISSKAGLGGSPHDGARRRMMLRNRNFLEAKLVVFIDLQDTSLQ